MLNEVLDFAYSIGAKDLKASFADTEMRSLFKRRNYFMLDPMVFLIVKISRSKLKNFWGISKKHLDVFDHLTRNKGSYFFVGLTSNHSGWVLSKDDLHNLIANETLSFSKDQQQYKVNEYNLKSNQRFSKVETFLSMV